MLKKMKKRGIKMGIGTDLVVDWIKYHAVRVYR